MLRYLSAREPGALSGVFRACQLEKLPPKPPRAKAGAKERKEVIKMITLIFGSVRIAFALIKLAIALCVLAISVAVKVVKVLAVVAVKGIIAIVELIKSRKKVAA